MWNLKSNLALICLFICACQSTNHFNLKTFHTSVDDLHVIEVESDRVRQECLFFNAEAGNNWRHQYLMYVLNDKNEILEIMQPTHQDKDSCYSQVREIEKLLRSESQVRLCVRDELKKRSQAAGSHDKIIQFGALGANGSTYEALTLDSVCNKKKCISSNDMWVNTCPGFVKL
jgi:hypothetical protein